LTASSFFREEGLRLAECVGRYGRVAGRCGWLGLGMAYLLLFVQGERLACAEPGGRVLGQYLERQWGGEQGLGAGQIYSIAQTPDGYLWIGTESNLIRFDGVRFTPIDPPDQGIGPISHVLGLLVDRGGALWVKLQDSRLLRYADGRFTLVSSPQRWEAGLTAMGRSQSGGVLTAGVTHGIGRIAKDVRKGLPIRAGDSLVLSIMEMPDGRVWVGTRESGLYWWRDGVMTRVSEGIPDTKINCLVAGGGGRIWIGTDNGIAVWDGAKATTIKLPAGFEHLQVLAMVEDHRGDLWAGTSRGLLRYNAAGAAWIPRGAREQGTSVPALFEDREENLWFGDGSTLERLRESRLISYGDAEEPPGDRFGAVYVDGHGRTWLAPLAGGLYWMRDEQMHAVVEAGLADDIVYSIDGWGDDVWVGRRKGGLTRLHASGDIFTAKTWTRADGLAQDSVYSVRAMRDGRVWAGTLTGGASHLVEDRMQTLGEDDGLASNAVTAIEKDRADTLWLGTPEGLSAFREGEPIKTLRGLPSVNILSLLADEAGGMWIGTASGLVYEEHGRVRSFAAKGLLSDAILGVACDGQGLLWISTPTRVLSVSREALLLGRINGDSVRVYGAQDGLQGSGGVRRSRSVVSDSLGRVWIVTNKGVAANFVGARDDEVAAMAHVERIVADGVAREALGEGQVEPGTRRLAFEYTGIDLRAPERVRFRYRLDGFDKRWSDPIQARRVEYTNLAPGIYRFRVMVANSEGEWSSEESSYSFRVEPMIWQRWEFQVLCFGALALIAAWIYRARMQYMVSQAHIRFEERLIERTRIARELHDTLLQGFISASLHLNITLDKVPDESPLRRSLQHVLQVMEKVIEEGRNAVKGLRSVDGANQNLEQAFRELVGDLSEEEAAAYKVEIVGEARALRPVVYEEVCRIGGEAVVNASRHADARHVTLRVTFGRGYLCLAIDDDGRGMDAVTAAHGRPGHFGLVGMRERAERIGAHLLIVSQPGQGTKIAVSVPARIAFEE
jgi:signal transduction histidine kinase/ligand-binding sensor domain-containing protein